MTTEEYVALALLKSWFPKRWQDESWLKSDDGAAWKEIALLDAKVAIEAWQEVYWGDDLK